MTPDSNTDPRIVAALEASIAAGEAGVQVAAYVDDVLVVDAWAGTFGPGSARLVDGVTLFSVFSITKVVTATAAHLQVQRGLLDYDRPIADIWPEFAAHGKGGVTLGHVLAHRSGVPQVPSGTTVERLLDWDWMTEQIAGLEPVALPDTMNAYSPIGFGWLVGELVRRTDPLGRDFADFARQEVLEPVGIDDFFLGLPETQSGRRAPLVGDEPAELEPDSLASSSSPPQLPFGPSLYNEARMLGAVLPSAGGVATARATARLLSIYAQDGVVDGTRLLTPETIERCTVPRPPDIDQTYGVVMPVGLGALWQIAPGVSNANGGSLINGILSHTGAGGTLAWAERDKGLSVAILHNRMFWGRQQVLPFGEIGDAIHAVVADLS